CVVSPFVETVEGRKRTNEGRRRTDREPRRAETENDSTLSDQCYLSELHYCEHALSDFTKEYVIVRNYTLFCAAV
uniref:Uncharacterized protein n=1 Tax=Ascaris lumbricoides TaxID=6252 RepID=A0A9J2PR94_ASCLU